MFIYNVKINGSKTFKAFFTGMTLFLIVIMFVVVFKIFTGANNSNDNTCMPKNKVATLTSTNYTNVLKAVHENIDDYVGVKFSFSGYVFRTIDFNDNQFVLARDMIISSDYQSVIVGFLCEYEKAKDFSDNSWVQITGEITKGDYHGDTAIVKVIEIKNIEKPNDEYVYPPDESYIPTSGLL